MKASYKPKAIKMIEKFDKQLRDMLTAELKTIDSRKNDFIARLRTDNDELQVA
ncbi:hypothetical protein [Hufsiella ginkgonis]|uniref:Uncharacterized protein n=1 Tax=Hufsiella ginkgonis TaxID=2695274 RepID=A0A7K1Y3I7_9SPHI|nr:hypothetical protein [Hufsiella ginkgonis]MXV17811.1 hypothetical protein [Hufsiella ginkgonis]